MRRMSACRLHVVGVRHRSAMSVEVAETFAPNVEVEVVMAGSLFQCAFCTELSIFEFARLLCYLQQLYTVCSARFVELGAQFLFRCRSRDVESIRCVQHCIQRHWATPSPTSQDERSASLKPFRAQGGECANMRWLCRRCLGGAKQFC